VKQNAGVFYVEYKFQIPTFLLIVVTEAQSLFKTETIHIYVHKHPNLKTEVSRKMNKWNNENKFLVAYHTLLQCSLSSSFICSALS